MNHRILKSVLIAAIGATATIASAETPDVEATTAPVVPVESSSNPTASDAEINALIGQLDNADPAIVTAARAKLVELGDRAKPALNRKLRAQTAATDVLATLASQQFTAPTLITLKLTDATPGEALEALSKEIGVSLKSRSRMYEGDATAKVTCDFKQQPFWTVVKSICEQGNLLVYTTPGEGGSFSIVPVASIGGRTSVLKMPTSAQGSTLVVLTNLTHTSSIDMQTLQPNKTPLMGSFEVWFEPKVKVSSVSRDVVVDEAIDDQGNALTIPATPPRNMGSDMATWTRIPMRANFSLDYPTQNAGKKLKSFRGKLKVTMAVNEQKEDLAAVLTGKEVVKTLADGKTVKFSDFKKNGNNYSVRVVSDGSMPITLTATDDAGQRFQQSGQTRGQQITVNFIPLPEDGQPIEGPPTKLSWVYPMKSQEVLVPFEFKDLPLP